MPKDKTHKDHKSMQKIFKVALVLFATTFGIGIYALVGAPIVRLSSLPAFTKIGNMIDKANVAMIGILPDSMTSNKVEKNYIKIELEKPDTDLHKIKMTFIDTPFNDENKRVVTLTKNGKEVSIPEFVYNTAKVKPSDSLLRVMNGSRYYMSYRDKDYKGTIIIPITDRDIAFASIIDFESSFLESTLPLVRPILSQSDIEMYKELKMVTRNISGVDTRVIIGSKDNILYAWGIYKNNIIISSNKDDYQKIIDILDTPAEKK